MGRIIDVLLRKEEQEVLKCSYMSLDVYAPRTGRMFVFSGIQFRKDDINEGDEINVEISINNRYGFCNFFIQFDILVLSCDFEIQTEDKLRVYGNVFNIGNSEYDQRVVDVFNMWQTDKSFDWFNCPVGSPLKLEYISACMSYSGLSKLMPEKNVFYFDMALVKEERDFFYLSSLDFVGDRGYFGHDLHTFKSCLLEIYNYCGAFQGKKVVFINSNRICSSEMEDLFENLKETFLAFSFLVEY
ncbi:hypothetical protein SAMN04488505_109123 [Chitinophaga rupis]|uniref:Uncharacterized protein n=1 Tax=Chitinophaga rupis TaxID=573321 RepID=A0A1H8F782_9BACT|nr:hypothetical protein [Chitinophaga rupis]SEN27500.1 hypothetical protein SAMN04488505_109123 [Chitinophaga rupis]